MGDEAADRLIRSDGTEGPVVVCRSVGFVDRSGWRRGDPATVGLFVPDLSGHDAARGDMLAGEAPPTQDGGVDQAHGAPDGRASG